MGPAITCIVEFALQFVRGCLGARFELCISCNKAFAGLVFLFLGLLGVETQGLAQTVSPSGSSYAPGIVWVRFTDADAQHGLNKADSGISGNAVERYGITSVKPGFLDFLQRQPQTESIVACGSTFAVYFDSQHPPEEVAAALAQDRDVLYAEPVPVRSVDGRAPRVAPNDPFYGIQENYLNRLELPAAWDVVKGDHGDVVIAFVDSGVDWRHEDLRSNAWRNPGEVQDNQSDDDANGYVDDVHGYDFGLDKPYSPGVITPIDHLEHGTRIAGVAAAVSDNSIGVSGSSWNAEFMSVGVSCGGSSDRACHMVPGVLYAASQGADIINVSLGGYEYSSTESACIDAATDMGALVVAAAGNDGINIDKHPYYPASYVRVLAVGATARERDLLLYNFGSTVDVFAPGSFVSSTIPGDQYDHSVTGSSIATPLVAGIAALVRTAFPEYSADQVRERIRQTADPIGHVNPPEYSGLLGHGRANAVRAVTEAWSFPPQLIMHGSYPNPFAMTTRIVFDLPVEARVRVEVMSMLGRSVWQGPSEMMNAGYGRHYVVDGRHLASGAYFYRLRAEYYTDARLASGMILLVR